VSLPLRWSRRDRPATTDPDRLPGYRELDSRLASALQQGAAVTLGLLQVDGLPTFRLIHGEDATDRLLDTVDLELRTVEDAEPFRLQHQVREAGLEPPRVVFEVWEHPCRDLALVTNELQALRSLGFRIALDDIGTGGTGLLGRHGGQLDLLKIAPSVTAGVGNDRRADAVVDAVCAYASRTGAQVIATGVESRDELRALRALLTPTPYRSLVAAQGYHLGAPTAQPGSRGTDAPDEIATTG